MDLTEAQVTQVFKIFGLPQNGAGRIHDVNPLPLGLGSIDYPVTLDYTEANAALTAALAALTASQITEVAALLTEWANITDFSEMEVSVAGDSRGQLVHHEKRRQHVRDTLSNIIGFFAPVGGFQAKAKRLLGGSHRITR